MAHEDDAPPAETETQAAGGTGAGTAAATDAKATAERAAAHRLPTESLRWRCCPEDLGPVEAGDVPPFPGIVGQEDAIGALRFGLEIYAPGQNVYVRGLSGTGRLSTVSQILKEIQPMCPLASDHAYVHDFLQPQRPRLLTLPRGRGRDLQARVQLLIDFIADDLGQALSSDAMQERRRVLEERAATYSQEVAEPFDQELRRHGLTLVSVQMGSTVQPAMVPLVDGAPAPPERIEQMRERGELSDERIEEIKRSLASYGERFQQIGKELQRIQRGLATEVRNLFRAEARKLLETQTAEIAEAFPQEQVRTFLADIVHDVVERRLRSLKEPEAFTGMYRVNLVLGHEPDDPCPIVVENSPTVQNLLGTIERELLPGGVTRSDHTMITGGSLLRAQGGYLVLEAREVLQEPGAWKVLVRSLRSSQLEIVPPDSYLPWSRASLKPEPIPLQVKVVLIGDPGLYGLLDAYDPDFPHLFKVLADFDDSIELNIEGLRHYAGVLARIARDEGLPSFDRSAIAALAEHGARIAGRNDRLTTRFGRLVDLAREAAFLTTKSTKDKVSYEEVRAAVHRSRRRADLPSRRFRKLVTEGTLRIQTSGTVVGQVNGLAVMSAGPITYGFPARITATIGPGTAGAINIEREAQLSGAIHTKGFYIQGGLLRHLLRTEHPLAFSASIAFEQSYGGIDGDSASGAEMCCLLSALTEVPLRQDLAMTGAIDQHGHIQPVGAVTEKIEGFFDTCLDVGLTGTQGVVIPRTNVDNLMLRHDVVEHAAEGRFHVYAVDTIEEALEIFTGRTAGSRDESGEYPEGSLLRLAVDKAYEYWLLAARPAMEWNAESVARAEALRSDAAAEER